MRDSTIVTHADVYSEEIPSTSDSVMMSGDSSPALQAASLPLMDCDVPDEARSDKTNPSTPIPTKLLTAENNTETIENAVPVAHSVLPIPEPQPKIERNGVDTEQRDTTNKPEDDTCLIDCIYFIQQCCECVIL